MLQNVLVDRFHKLVYNNATVIPGTVVVCFDLFPTVIASKTGLPSLAGIRDY